MSKVILFGGTFDPIHDGHLFIANKALRALKADKVLFMLAKRPRWKDPSAEADHRLNMLKLALEPFPNYEISLIEYDSKAKTNYTCDTVEEYLRQKPEDSLCVLIGADQLEVLDQWKDIAKLAKAAKIVVYGRKNTTLSKENIKKYGVTVVKGAAINISSTEIRTMKSIETPREVLDYILLNRLYFANRISTLVSEKRYFHTISVAMVASSIARGNYLSSYPAFVAGMLHDIGKETDKEDARRFIEKTYPQYLHLPSFSYHQFIGRMIAEEEFGVSDEDILNAIGFHATGRSNMSRLEKIVYAADKIEPLRGFDSEELIRDCIKDIDKGFVKVLISNRQYLLSKKLDISNEYTKACMLQYLRV